MPAAEPPSSPRRREPPAAGHGRVRELAAVLFRRNFVTGEGLLGEGAVRACWTEAGLDGAAYDAAVEAARPVLVAATEGAIADGVPGVPTVTVVGRHFWGDDRLEDAATQVEQAVPGAE